MPQILFVGEYYDDAEERANKPFAGSAGQVLRGIMQQAGIESAGFDTVFRLRPTGGRLESLLTRDRKQALAGYPPIKPGHFIDGKYAVHLQRFHARIAEARPNIIVALGTLPLWALTRRVGIKKFRGSPLLSHDGQFKVLPTWHPASIIRQWNLRPVVFMDLCKAQAEAADPRLVRPRRTIHLEPTISEIAAFYQQHIVPAAFVACDIETKAGTITEIGFAPSRNRCLVIPFWKRGARDGNYWPTAEAEREAWDWVRRICTTKRLVGQNFQYDMQYLSRTVGIPCPGFHGDTMLLHHALQPELEKGLGFLGSVYTNEPSWKFMRTDHSTLKREDD